MDIKKIKEKNPGWEFSTKVSKKASKDVKATALKPKLDIDAYVAKYADQVKSQKDSIEPIVQKDKNWTMLKKKKIDEDNTDSSFEESKAAFYDEEGNEEASEG